MRSTLRLTPEDLPLSEANMLASGGYLLRVTSSEKSVVEMTGGFKDNATATWREGVTNPISKGGTESFVVTAEDGRSTDTYKISIAYDDRPVLKEGTVQRLSDTQAKVTFTSTGDGMYYFQVAEQGAQRPVLDTQGVGVKVVAGRETVISLSNLTAGGKDLYIQVKNDDNASDIKLSDVLRIQIPQYDEAAVRYKISVVQTPGGKIAVDKTEAKPGETITVTVTPDTGKQMTAKSLKYSQAGPPYAVKDIDETTRQFQMSEYELSVSCRFEDAGSSGDDTDNRKLSGFVINGVNGVINHTTGAVTITLPSGTDLSGLKPVVTAQGAVSISPASGTAVNLTGPVTYTITFADGTTKQYTVTAYTEVPSSDKLWEKLLGNTGGSTGSSGPGSWQEKARRIRENNDFLHYW